MFQMKDRKVSLSEALKAAASKPPLLLEQPGPPSSPDQALTPPTTPFPFFPLYLPGVVLLQYLFHCFQHII